MPCTYRHWPAPTRSCRCACCVRACPCTTRARALARARARARARHAAGVRFFRASLTELPSTTMLIDGAPPVHAFAPVESVVVHTPSHGTLGFECLPQEGGGVTLGEVRGCALGGALRTLCACRVCRTDCTYVTRSTLVGASPVVLRRMYVV